VTGDTGECRVLDPPLFEHRSGAPGGRLVDLERNSGIAHVAQHETECGRGCNTVRSGQPFLAEDPLDAGEVRLSAGDAVDHRDDATE
jgi:hypothetical protein